MEQEKYMGIDEFLEKYYRALSHTRHPESWGNNFFWSMASKTPKEFFEWYNEHKEQLRTPELQELYAEIAKAQAAGTQDAKNFLYTVQVLTAFDNAFTDEKVPSRQLDEYTKIILNAIKRGVIKNPENSYNLLKHAYSKQNTDGQREISRALALHTLATPYDVTYWLGTYVEPTSRGPWYDYRRLGSSTPQFIGSIDDAKKKLNDLVADAKVKLDAEMSKPMPNIDTIKSFEIDVIPMVAYQIAAIVDFMALTKQDSQTAADVEKAKSVAAELAREFDMNKILDVEHGNYVQQYADQAEIQIAEMRPAFEKMQNELETLRPAYTKQNRQLMKQSSSISNLEDDKAKLLRENQNLLSTLEFLKGKVKLFLKMFGERADKRELPIQKAKGLQEIVEDNLRKAVDIEQIERDLRTAKERQTKIMQNSPVRI